MKGESQMQLHHNTFLIAAIFIVILLLGGIFIAYYSSQQVKPLEGTPTPQAQSETPVATQPAPEILVPTTEVVPDAITNPIKDLPKSNPFETQTNPFENAYKNPFE